MSNATALTRHLSKTDLVHALDFIETARRTGTEQQFVRLIHQTSNLIPAEKAHVGVAVIDAESRVVDVQRHINVNFPREVIDEYMRRGYLRNDAFTTHLARAERPFMWRDLQQQYRSEGHKEIYAYYSDCGLRDGFSAAARFTQAGLVSVFSFACSHAELSRHRRHIAVVEYLAPFLHAALAKVHHGVLKEVPVLTEREVQVMHWAKFGKTDWEISLQMSICPRTVKFHIENVMRKLQASNRLQATAVALSHGLIDWG